MLRVECEPKFNELDAYGFKVQEKAVCNHVGLHKPVRFVTQSAELRIVELAQFELHLLSCGQMEHWARQVQEN